MSRVIKECRAQSTIVLPQTALLPAGMNVKSWLEQQAQKHAELGLRWLLAHADDGVIWGEMRGPVLKTLETSHSAAPEYSPPLRAATLQQARLFSPQGELLLWRDGDQQWNARLLRELGPEQAAGLEQEVGQEQMISQEQEDGLEQSASWSEYFDEPQLLWGTQVVSKVHGFTLWRDGAQGLHHAVPIVSPQDQTTPPLLWVRHYLADEDFARIAASRLVKLG